jgi:ankyrin repeat protein
MNKGLPIRVMGALAIVMTMAAATPAEAPVADAAMKGDVETVRALLRDGADVNAAQGDGMTALHWAAERSDEQMVEMLLYAGAKVDVITRIGQYTPLHLASRTGNAPVASRLLDMGADVGAVTSPAGTTPLHLAAASGYLEILDLLIGKGAEVDALDAAAGQTPLVFAASMNRAATAARLLSHGADPSIHTTLVDFAKKGELDRAAGQRQSEVMDAMRAQGTVTPSMVQAAVRAGREILESGVIPEKDDEEEENEDDNPFRRNRPSSITAMGGMTALLHAARQGHIEVAKELLAGGADVDQVSTSDATSPLLVASINGQFDMAMLLLEAGADANIESSVNGVSPLWAVVNSKWQPRTRFPQPQEHHLQNTTYLELLEAMLVEGAEPDRRTTMHPWYMVYGGCGNQNCGLADTKGSTAFWRAAYAVDVSAMRMLVKYGADPTIPTLAPEQRRRRLPPTQALAQQARRQVGEAAFFDMEEEERVSLLKSVRKELPEAQQAEFADDELADISEERRDELLSMVVTADSIKQANSDPSGLAPYESGGPGVYPINAAAGSGHGEGFAGNAQRHMPDGWLPAVKYLIEVIGADVNQADHNGYRPLHNAAGRGDNELIIYLVGQGGDVNVLSRRGQTTVDLANGPVQRVPPYIDTVTLLMGLGALNSDACVSC